MAAVINSVLEAHLFQVIGSTPASIVESIKKVDIRAKPQMGAMVFTVCVFAAAVNKPTLETFLAKPELASIRPLINAALSIQGRSNMTALTLLGHCLMTTKFANDVTFVQEFRKKMGQDHLWAGNLESGSLSEKQKGILKEKKRVTSEVAARALGSGFIKWVGLVSEHFTEEEARFWGQSTVVTGGVSTEESVATAATVPALLSTSTASRRMTPPFGPDAVVFDIPGKESVLIPANVLDYRRNMLKQSDASIIDSINRRGLTGFIDSTKQLMERDPDGSKTRAASIVG